MKITIWNGKPISKPGVYSDIPLDKYHEQICDAPSVSSSGLRRLFSKSPAHFYAEWSGNPDADEPEDKQHYILGRAAHHLFLGEENFQSLFCVRPEEYPDKSGVLKKWTYAAAYCDRWRTQQQNAGLSILSAVDFDNIRGMAESLANFPLVRDGALNGLIERSAFWKDKATGLWIKIRPDAMPTTSMDFVDLKTTTSVIYQDLQSTIGKFGYNQQGALNRTGAREILGIDKPTFTLIFVESKKPWCVRAVTLKDNDLDRGEQQNRYALDAVARCIKSKRWPGPGGERDDAEHIELPTWQQNQIDEKLRFGL